MLRDSVQTAVPNGAGRPGWLGPAGKRIAAREPPKLDYSCHATLNGVTHVRDWDPVASRGRNTLVQFCSVPFESDRIGQASERTDRWTDGRCSVSPSLEKFRFNLGTPLAAPALMLEIVMELMKFPDGLPLIMPTKALASLQLTHGNDDDHR